MSKPHTDDESRLSPYISHSISTLLATTISRHTCIVCNVLPVILPKHTTHTHFYSLHTHIQLPVLSKGLGKRVFKRHLELFLDPIFYSLVITKYVMQYNGKSFAIKVTEVNSNLVRGVKKHCSVCY